ncbi:MAG: trypsin-like serine protease [Pseudomonadota bacterium]
MPGYKPFLSPMVLLVAISVGACDVVQFPGGGARQDVEARPVPPPPPTTEINPIPLSDGVLDDASFDDSPDTLIEAPIDTSPINESSPNWASIPTDLAGVNALRCAPSTEETRTVAEATDARPAEAVFSTKTVNGTIVTAADFPGIVKMEPRRQIAEGISSGHCGATRISNNWFVTAAHCLDNTYDDILLIATESNLRNPFAERLSATASICHAAYGGTGGNYANDIALVAISDTDADKLVNTPIARFENTQSSLNKSAYPSARMAGWGLTSFGGNLSDTLLAAEVDLVATGPAAITVASREGAGPCIGDSGGPLIVDEPDGSPTVVGVLSVVEQNRTTGEFCSGEYRARYTNVQGYIGWIEDVIATCDSNPDLCAR